jgi:CubicO group peptidase (beta-lactamase class C family)
MRNRILLAGVFSLLTIGVHEYAWCICPSANPGQPRVRGVEKASRQTDLETRIARIENGLLPAVTIKGQPLKMMTISDRMKHYKVPGVSLAFFDHEQILWTRTYGFADVATKRPVRTETLFQAASISKPVSALAALRLVQEGKVSLDEDVNVKLRTWKVPENEFTKEEKVTLRRILSHSAGLTVHGFPGYASSEPLPTIIQILNGEKPANTAPIRVDTVPGTLWRYSGGGYVVMQLLVSDVTGKRFPQILHDLVLQPAGMKHSTYEQPLPEDLKSSAATPYSSDGGPVKGGWHTYPEMAPAGLWTTPSDLARLAIVVQKEYAGKSSKVLSQEMMRQMLTPQKANSGLGFALGAPGHKLRFGHGGANEGFRCNLEAYMEGEGIAIMTNSDNGGELSSEVLRAVAKEYRWPDFQSAERAMVRINPALLPTYAGVYEISGLGKQTVTAKDGRLYLKADPLGPEPQELLPESDTRFFLLSQDLTFIFQKDETGTVSKFIIEGESQTFEARRIP